MTSPASINAEITQTAPTLAKPTVSQPGSGWRFVGIATAWLAAASLTFFLSNYVLFLLTMTLITAIAVLGVNILIGYNGQLTLGHGAIYALGAYVTAIMMDQWGAPWWSTLSVSAAICFLFGFLFGWPALRLKGHYLALATFALAVATPQILKHKALHHWTGGVQGLVLTKPEAPAGVNLSADQWLYLMVLLIAGVFFIAAWNIVRGRLGRATVAIREQAVAASVMGVNVAYIKTMTFGISALYTGVAGSLSAVAAAYVAPDSFTLFVSLSFVVGAIVGGLGTIVGPLIGAAFIQFVPNIADHFSKSAPAAIFAAILILSIFIMPRGIVGLVRTLARRMKVWTSQGGQDPAR